MDTQEQKPQYNHPNNKGRVWGGLFLLLLGGIFLMKETNYFLFPYWLFTWPMILIAVGVFVGLKHGFRGPGWLILIIIGVIFLADQIDIGIDLHHFLVPGIIIAVGLMMILRPKPYRRNRNWEKWGNQQHWQQWSKNHPGNIGNTYQPNTGQPGQDQPSTGSFNTTSDGKNYTGEDFIDSTSIFGNVQKIVTSKNFKGGDITCFLGGAEIDLQQADINGVVIIDVTTVLGGAKLIVPQNWEVRSEISTVFGGMEDKRQTRGNIIDFNKVLVLKGTAFMGGIEIKSF